MVGGDIEFARLWAAATMKQCFGAMYASPFRY
jgi:hypothetical protein